MPKHVHNHPAIPGNMTFCSSGASATNSYQQPARFSKSGNRLSARHFAENTALRIEVARFASVVYGWRSPCIPGYCRNVASQIPQPMMS
jgi:hypothetical protein